MSITTTAFRIALVSLALCSVASAADAKPRRVVILDFDGPRSLADTGRGEVVALLGEHYDVVAKKRWEEARAKAQQKSAGPTTWQKAAKSSGVDAIIEGWISDDGRHKQLTVAVREASTGQEIDSVSVRLSAKGLSEQNRSKLQSELDGVLDYVEGAPEPYGSSLRVIDTRKMIGAKPSNDESYRDGDSDDDTDEDRPKKKRRKAKRVAELEDEAPAPEATDEEAPRNDGRAKRKAKDVATDDAIELEGDDDTAEPTERREKRDTKDIAAKENVSLETKESSDLVSLFGATSDEGKIADPQAAHVPVPTPRFRVGGGGYYGSRSLTFGAENQAGPQAYAGVPSQGLEVNGAVYPFPRQKFDGGLSGIGFTFGVSKSAGAIVSFDDGTTVSEYSINQTAYKAGIHYRHQLASLVTIDGEVNYGKSSYLLPDAPVEFEVPDVDYSYIGAGAKLDLNIVDRASVGFGARYMYLLDTGDITSVDWYGPGRASGWGIDGDFVIPLPSRLYIRGALAYEKFKIAYDGVGVITEEEGVYESSDSTVNGSLNLGILF